MGYNLITRDNNGFWHFGNLSSQDIFDLEQQILNNLVFECDDPKTYYEKEAYAQFDIKICFEKVGLDYYEISQGWMNIDFENGAIKTSLHGTDYMGNPQYGLDDLNEAIEDFLSKVFTDIIKIDPTKKDLLDRWWEITETFDLESNIKLPEVNITNEDLAAEITEELETISETCIYSGTLNNTHLLSRYDRHGNLKEIVANPTKEDLARLIRDYAQEMIDCADEIAEEIHQDYRISPYT